MPKKIFDILPPKKETKLTFLSEKKIEKEIKEKITFPELSLRKKKFVLIFILFLIFVFATSFNFSKAKIKIWPEVELVNFNLKVQLDKEVQNLDFENKILPGKIFELEKTFAEEFPATGRIQKYAQGKIRLYNSFTTQQEIWREKTRFLSKEEKLFLSKDKIVVPGASVKNGKITPSFVDVEVIASEPGADYNIGPTTFSIVAFRGTPRYDKYYGESFQPMTGGGESFQVKKADLENAEKILTEKVKKEMEEIMRNEIPIDFVFLKEALDTKILEKTPLAKEGQELAKFHFQIKAKGSTLTFKQEDLENLVVHYILSQIPEGKAIFRESLKINYSLEKIDFQLSKAVLSVDCSAQIYSKLELREMEKMLAGKSLKEAKNFLEQQPEILRIEAQFSPFWIKKFPRDIERIEIEYPMVD